MDEQDEQTLFDRVEDLHGDIKRRQATVYWVMVTLIVLLTVVATLGSVMIFNQQRILDNQENQIIRIQYEDLERGKS